MLSALSYLPAANNFIASANRASPSLRAALTSVAKSRSANAVQYVSEYRVAPAGSGVPESTIPPGTGSTLGPGDELVSSIANRASRRESSDAITGSASMQNSPEQRTTTQTRARRYGSRKQTLDSVAPMQV